MSAVITRDVLTRWVIRGAHCTTAPEVESAEHARYLLSAHAGHGGCTQFLGALAYGSEAGT
ncbi:hypothetical protein [Nocardia australiensis]|uniref:hypothetical protein n=1 Tax=Nocardia australiensis TaxID=2887191 RepID=UPI001D15A763|nr:hypothetical protein [Nocardia australiensis]